LPVVGDDGRLLGALYVDALLACVASERIPADVRPLISRQLPTCKRASTVYDAVRQMIACHLMEIPVVDDQERLLGVLTLSEAAAAGERDPVVRELFEALTSPSLFAEPWR
jgi:CBS domain-containing protein